MPFTRRFDELLKNSWIVLTHCFIVTIYRSILKIIKYIEEGLDPM